MVRRTRSNSNSSFQTRQNNSRNAHLSQLRALTNQSPHPAAGGMSPGSRYNHNLKVLRRRDPSIVSIFDQFSHVCLYHHNGEKWEKKGYEGSMFLYERNAYPPYGFYILNRMGMDDYIQRMYPEDDMNILGDYLMYKCYPDYTGLRLGLHMENHRGVDPDLKNDKHKGRSITVGLWMFATESREPMKDVMMRLHDYIRRNESYPEQFRYGPDHPPPPNPHLRVINDSSPEHIGNENEVDKLSNGNLVDDHGVPGTSGNTDAMTEIDMLFAKIAPTQSLSQPTKVVSKVSVNSLFAAALGNNESSSHSLSPGLRASSSVSNRGLALLDSIFASAAPTTNDLPSSQKAVLIPTVPIVSPKPTVTTAPQVLNQSVISTLLGLTPSPGGSASSSSTNRTGGRYEGDNESNSEGGFSEGELSASSTVLDEDIAAQTSAGRPSERVVPSFSFTNVAADFNNQGLEFPQVQGDVTPRPAHRGMRTSTPPQVTPNNKKKASQLQPQHKLQQRLQPTNPSAENSMAASNSTPSRRPESASSRAPVPFEPKSELWSYPRAPLDDRSLDADCDVVELDFNDISILSDPHAFEGMIDGKGGLKKKGNKKDQERAKEEMERGWDDSITGAPAVQPNTITSTTTLQKPIPTKGKEKQAADRSNGLLVNGATPAKTESASTTAHKPIPNKLDRNAAKESLLATASSVPNLKPVADSGKMGRNEFVREVLTLIHTDKSFVDSLWANYLAHATN